MNVNSNQAVPTAWDAAVSDFSNMGGDFLRLGSATLTCASRTTSLTVRTTVVTIETVNVGLGYALEVMPRSFQETQDDLMSMFTAVKDDTVPSIEADKPEQ